MKVSSKRSEVLWSTATSMVVSFCVITAFYSLFLFAAFMAGILISHIQLKTALAKEKDEEDKALAMSSRKAPVKRPKRAKTHTDM